MHKPSPAKIRIGMRFEPQQKELVRTAAALNGQSMAAFVVEAARQAADRTLATADTAAKS